MDSMGKEESQRHISRTSPIPRRGLHTMAQRPDVFAGDECDFFRWLGNEKSPYGCLGDFCRGMKYYPNNTGIVI